MKKLILTSLSVLIAGFYASAQVACQAGWTSNATPASGAVMFSDLSQVGGAPSTAFTSYSWDFGDGNTGYGTSPMHTYAQSGMYYVCLTISVIDSNSAMGTVLCSSTWCDSVIVGSGGGGGGGFPCHAGFSIDSLLTGSGVAYIYNNSTPLPTATTSVMYTWDFGDGTTSSQPFPTHVYQSSGWYVVCVTIHAVNAQGDTCSDIYCDSLGVDSLGNILYKTNGPGFTLNVLDPAAPFSVNENEIEDLTIYPNPAANRITVEAKGLRGTVNWSVRDMRGAVVMSGADAVNLGSTTIDVAELTEGFYVLTVESGKTVHNQKLQIRR